MRIKQKDFYTNFKNRVQLEKEKALNLLPESGLIGIGASISTTHLLHEFNLGERFILLLDDNKQKTDTYSPGFGIPVKPLNNFRLSNSNNFAILAWQHSNLIRDKIRDKGHLNQIYQILPQFSLG